MTTKNPIEFFEDFCASGFQDYYNKFLGNDKKVFANANLFEDTISQSNSTQLIDEVLSVTEEESNSGCSGSYIFFSDFLVSLLDEQKNNSCKKIDEAILGCNGKHQALYYLEIVSSKIRDIINKMESSEVKYSFLIKQALEELIDETYKKYSYIANDSEAGVESNKLIQKSDSNSEAVAISPFRVRNQYIHKLDSLYDELIANGFIDKQTSSQTFISVFGGNEFSSESRIRWSKRGKSKDISKPTIFYFIHTLTQEGVIDAIEDKELKVEISKLFVDMEGNPFENIQESFSYYKQRMGKEKLTKDDKNLRAIILRVMQ